jgi:hypothetical protein
VTQNIEYIDMFNLRYQEVLYKKIFLPCDALLNRDCNGL